MRSFIGIIFILCGILSIFSDAPLWDSMINLAIGYLLLDKEEK